MDYLKEPNTRGIWRIDLENSHVNEFDEPENGQGFVGYRTDGRALVHDETCSTIRVVSCHANSESQADRDTEYGPCDEPCIEHWIRENKHQIAALHLRYYWILERVRD